MATAAPIALAAPAGATLYAGKFQAGLYGGSSLGDVLASGALGNNAADLAGSILLDGVLPAGTLRDVWPEWRSAMAPNTWAVVPVATTLAQVDPALDPALNPYSAGAAPWRGTGGQSMVLDAWNSFVPSVAPNDGRMWVTCCGGHADYAGNEHYEIDLLDEAPAWVLRRRPSSNAIDGLISLNDGQESTGLYSDGRIRSTHVYQTQCHVPGRGIFMSDNTACYYTATGGPRKAFWVAEDGEHTVACDFSALPIFGSFGGTCHDTTRDVLWFTRSGGLTRMGKYDPNSGAVTAHGVTDSWVGVGARMIYLPAHDLVVQFTAINSGLVLWDPAANTWKRSVTTSGTRPAWLAGGVTQLGNGGSAWIPHMGTIVLWNNSSSTDMLATLTPGPDAWNDPWLWGELAPNPANAVVPPAKPSSGGAANILGKFGYLPALNGCFLQTQFSDDLYFYSLAAP